MESPEGSAAISADGVPGTLASAVDAGDAATKALEGDPDAAAELVLYFLGQRNDLEKARFWQQIAIENGDSGALLTRANLLIGSADPCLRLRGIHLLELALENPSPGLSQTKSDWHETLSRAKDRTREVPGDSCLELTAAPFPF